MSRTPLFRLIGRVLSQAGAHDRSAVPISRRDALRLTAASTSALYLNACQTAETVSTENLLPLKEGGAIAIVGGGAAGLSAAYYLKKAGVRSHVYEANDRLGGRIFTEYGFNPEQMFCERGGELIDTGHKEIQNLMTELGLKLQSLPDPGLALESYFFGGQWRNEQELVKAFRPLAAKIAEDAQGFMVNDAFQMPSYKNPISDAIKRLDGMSLKAYLDSARDIADAWIRELIRVAYVGEYGLEAEEQSAINLVSYIGTDLAKGFQIFGESDELYRIEGGSSQLIEALSKQLPGSFSLGHTLKSIARGRDGQFQLLFQVAGGKVIEVKSRLCVIALPFSVLRGIKGIDTLGLSPRKLTAIRELGYGTNSKLMLGFRRRYWRDKGQSFPANDGNLMTDLPFQGGWDTSRRQKGKSGIFTNFMGGTWAETFAAAKVRSSLSDLEKVYPGISQEHDGKRVLQVWSAVPTARGSYICLKPGQYTTLGGCFGEAECEGSLLFAGEHTSEIAAGFMNGAVESGLRVATSLLAGAVTAKSA